MTSRSVPPAWEARHLSAFTSPRLDERDLVVLCKTIHSLVNMHGTDLVLRSGLGDLIVGARVLLNADWGQRLDMGSVDSFLCQAAERMGFDLDTETFR